MTPHLAFLRIPLSALEFATEIAPLGTLTPRELDAFAHSYRPPEIEAIVAALRHAEHHPEHDFAAMLPGLRFSNPQIHAYLVRLLRSLEPLQGGHP